MMDERLRESSHRGRGCIDTSTSHCSRRIAPVAGADEVGLPRPLRARFSPLPCKFHPRITATSRPAESDNGAMRYPMLAAVTLALAGAIPVSAQVAPAPPPVTRVVAVAGCVTQEGARWFLTNATPPLSASGRAPGGGGAPGTDEGALSVSLTVTAQMAARQLPGTARYRLIGLLDELGLVSRKGQTLIVRGPLLNIDAEKRINLMSITGVSSTCRTRPVVRNQAGQAVGRMLFIPYP